MADSRPLVELLGVVLTRGEQFLALPEVKVSHVTWFNSTARQQLGRIYGIDSAALGAFPLVDALVGKGPPREYLTGQVELMKRLIGRLSEAPQRAESASGRKRIFIGHGRSPLWRELKDFLWDRLKLPWDEFNREAVAGYPTSERLHMMLRDASFALLVMTAEEEHPGGLLHARENVVHEVGLFQGRLGFPRAVVLLEQGCAEFSNIVGLGQIRFPKGQIAGAYEDIRRTLQREKLIPDNAAT